MAKKKKFQMRPEPKAPERNTVRTSADISDFESLGDLIKWWETLRVQAPDLQADDVRFDTWWDSTSVFAHYPEPDKRFQERVRKYEAALKEWKKWAEEHKAEIEAHQKKEEVEELKQKRQRLEELQREAEEIEAYMVVHDPETRESLKLPPPP